MDTTVIDLPEQHPGDNLLIKFGAGASVSVTTTTATGGSELTAVAEASAVPALSAALTAPSTSVASTIWSIVKAWPLQTQEVLGRLLAHAAAYGPSVADLVALVEALNDLGFQPVPPKKRGSTEASDRAYLRWVRVGTARTAKVYLDTLGVTSDSKPQLAVAESLPGAVPEGGVHPRVHFRLEGSSVQVIRDAIEALSEFADQED